MQKDLTDIDNKKSPIIISSKKHTLLFVDDEIKILKALKRVFVDDYYTILTAENGRAALDILADNKINLVISDYSMSGMFGIDLLSAVKQRYPGTIRILLTAYMNNDVVKGVIADGTVHKFINKPWNDDDLRLAVKQALEQYNSIEKNT